LGYQSPLYGRRTAQFKIEPLDYCETASFFTRFTPRDIAVVYGMTGGIPLYLEQFDDRHSLARNITQAFFRPSAYLFEEPVNLLKQEVRDPSYYNAIVRTVANGATRLGEIASKVGLETSACTVYLKNLIDLGILRKEFPAGEHSPRKGMYVLADHLFRFWYLFVSPHISMIQRGMADAVWNRIESEIDIVGFTDTEAKLFGECKWTDKDVDHSVLELLVDRAQRFHPQAGLYYLFAKKGFTPRCRALALSRGDTALVTLEDIRRTE